MITGTSHFTSKVAAIRYYARQGIDRAGVAEKLTAGEIHIGQPTLKPGDKLHVIQDEGRYAIEHGKA